MKTSEFYENYWRIKNAQGEWVPPPPLSQKEKEFLDSCPPNATACFYRTRRRPVYVNLGMLQMEMDKLPRYFFPVNQPKLDKYGGYENEEAPPLK